MARAAAGAPSRVQDAAGAPGPPSGICIPERRIWERTAGNEAIGVVICCCSNKFHRNSSTVVTVVIPKGSENLSRDSILYLYIQYKICCSKYRTSTLFGFRSLDAAGLHLTDLYMQSRILAHPGLRGPTIELICKHYKILQLWLQ